MFCQRCGSKLADDAVTCGLCGQPVYNMTYPIPNVPVNGGVASNALGTKPSYKINVPGLIFAGIFAMGSFLPYVSISVWVASTEKSLIDGGDGIIFLAVALIAALASVRISGGWSTVLIVMGLVAILITAFEAIHTFHKAEYAAFYSRSIGYYCTLIGSGGIIFSGIYGAVKK